MVSKMATASSVLSTAVTLLFCSRQNVANPFVVAAERVIMRTFGGVGLCEIGVPVHNPLDVDFKYSGRRAPATAFMKNDHDIGMECRSSRGCVGGVDGLTTMLSAVLRGIREASFRPSRKLSWNNIDDDPSQSA